MYAILNYEYDNIITYNRPKECHDFNSTKHEHYCAIYLWAKNI